MLAGFRYNFLYNIRNRSQLFWSLLFPLILGTFFFFAFSDINANTEEFSLIPVAIVEEPGADAAAFKNILAELESGGEPLVDIHETDQDEADAMLAGGDVQGIYIVGDSITLKLAESGINQSILKTVSDTYLQVYEALGDIAQVRPEFVQQAAEMITGSLEDVNTEVTLGKGQLDDFLPYYFAIIAMTCLFGCYAGMYNVLHIQADQGPVAARRSVTPTRKIAVVLTDFLAALSVQFLLVCIVLAYLIFALRIDFGDQIGFVLLTCLCGSIAGVSMGMFVGCLVKAGENVKTSILTGVSLFMCFLSGLMIQGVKDSIEHTAPIVNRLNPAAMLSDAFYCLTVYTGYERFARNIISLLAVSAIFLIGSSLVLRRQRYASI